MKRISHTFVASVTASPTAAFMITISLATAVMNKGRTRYRLDESGLGRVNGGSEYAFYDY